MGLVAWFKSIYLSIYLASYLASYLSISYYHRHRNGAGEVQRNALLLTTWLRFTLHHRQH